MTIINEQGDPDERAHEEIASYLQDLAGLPALSLQEEQQLIQLLGQATADPARCNAARQRLLEGFLSQVVQAARHHLQPNLELADLVQEGNLALLHALRSFDPQHHPPLRSFAQRFVCWHLSNVVNAARHRDETLSDHENTCRWCDAGEKQAATAWSRKERVQEVKRA